MRGLEQIAKLDRTMFGIINCSIDFHDKNTFEKQSTQKLFSLYKSYEFEYK